MGTKNNPGKFDCYADAAAAEEGCRRPAGDNNGAQQPPRPFDELDPHAYVPSAMHMGDCAICGHLQGEAIHSPFRRT